MDASALGFAHLGKTVKVRLGRRLGTAPIVAGARILVAVTHQNPVVPGGQGFLTILTVALSWADGNLSNVVISPSADVTIDED